MVAEPCARPSSTTETLIVGCSTAPRFVVRAPVENPAGTSNVSAVMVSTRRWRSYSTSGPAGRAARSEGGAAGSGSGVVVRAAEFEQGDPADDEHDAGDLQHAQ
jgi:hypothetical protein